MPVPASIRSLARDLALSIATVSEALRDSPQVKPSTKARILAAAAAAGYRRNPLLGATFSALRLGRHQGFSGTLALVDYAPEGRRPELMLFHREIVRGATARARELGFNTEVFWIGRAAPALSVGRLNSVLRARGIPGVIFLPFDQTQDVSGVTLEQLAAVSMEHRLVRPQLNTIQPDHYLSMRHALGVLAARGYRRIGLCLEASKDERVDHKWSSGFLSAFRLQPPSASVPPLIAPRLDRPTFGRWFRLHRPDVIIGHQEAIADWLESLGCRVPDHVGFFRINVTERSRPCAGLDLLPEQLGATAVEAVVGSLHRREQGAPRFPKSISVNAEFVDGPTLRPAPDPAQPPRRGRSGRLPPRETRGADRSRPAV